MEIARKLIKKVDKIMDNAHADDNYPRSILKAMGAGAIEGIVDGLILAGLVNAAIDIYKFATKK